MNIISNGTTNSSAGDFEKRLETTLQKHEDNKKKLILLQQRVAELQEAIALKQKRPQEKEGNIALASRLAVERTELSGILEKKKKMTALFDQIKGHLACSSCKKVALLPMIAGPCGHIHCQSCLVHIDEVAAKEMEAKDGLQQDSVRYLCARKCVCMQPILGNGVPVLPLKAIGNLLAEEGMLSPSEMDRTSMGSSFDLHLGKGVLENALGIAAWASFGIAKKSMRNIMEKIQIVPWKEIRIYFHEGNLIIFNTFLSILGSEKKLLISTSNAQRSISVSRNVASFPDAASFDVIVSINVEPNGCFTINSQ